MRALFARKISNFSSVFSVVITLSLLVSGIVAGAYFERFPKITKENKSD